MLLDPVQYPGAKKAFAREVCRNDLLNFGRLHFFFPDSRMSLDLNTDKTLKVAVAITLLSYHVQHHVQKLKATAVCFAACCCQHSNCAI